MAAARYENAGAVRIAGKNYRLVRRNDTQQDYVHGFEDEPPWSGGAPSMISEETYTWHIGGLKSRPGIPGTSEYGRNSDGRFPFRLLPSAKINALTLTSSASTPTSIFEALGYVFVVAGRRVYRIDPATNTVVLSKDFGGGGTLGVMGTRWEENFALVTTDAASDSLWKLESGGIVGGGPDTWTQTSDVWAYRLAAGINRLFAIDKDGLLSNVSTGLDPMVAANYADAVQCGDTDTVPTGMVAYERTVFVAKPEAVYGVGDDGFGLPILKRMARDSANGAGMTLADPYVLVPHARGLWRYVPGLAEAAGIEREIMNESPVQGRWRAFAADSEWLYGCLEVGGTDTYVMVARERRGGETSFGPYIWDTWLYFAQLSKAAHISALSTYARLYFGHGNDVAYVELPNGPGSVKYATTANRYSHKYRFEDWGSKDFPKIDVVGKNVDSTCYWTVNYSVDGGAYSGVDAAGAAMRVNSNGRFTFFLPTTAVGREIQFRFDYTSDDDTQAGELLFFQPYAIPAARKQPLIIMYLELAEGIRQDEGTEDRSAAQAFNDLMQLTEAAAAVETSGPWGEGLYANPRRVRVAQTSQEGQSESTFIVEFAMLLRETS